MTTHSLVGRDGLLGLVISDLSVLEHVSPDFIAPFAATSLGFSDLRLFYSGLRFSLPVELLENACNGFLEGIFPTPTLSSRYGSSWNVGNSSRAIMLVAVLTATTRTGIPFQFEIAFVVGDFFSRDLIQNSYGDC